VGAARPADSRSCLPDPQARAAAVAELCQGYEARLDDERRANAALSARLKEALDRSAKMRGHAEKERRALQLQVEKLQAAADAGARAAEARAAEWENQRSREAAEWEARVEAEREARVSWPTVALKKWGPICSCMEGLCCS
jgi:hypothetical protein